jgi:hypothetical protein
VKTCIRKTTACLFLLLGLSPLFIAFSVTVREYVIRERMRKMLESHDLQTVVVAERDVIWMDDHEIWVNESMFDIRTKKLENGIYTFTGLYDADETELVREQQKKKEHTQTPEEKIIAQTLQALTRLYTETGEDETVRLAAKRQYNDGYHVKEPQFIPTIVTPPPRRVFSHC